MDDWDYTNIELEGMAIEPEPPAMWDLLADAFEHNAKLHSFLALYRVLEKYEKSGAVLPNNEKLGKICGIAGSTAKRGLRIFKKLGVILLTFEDKTRHIYLPKLADPHTTFFLTGNTEIDPKNGQVTHVDCGRPVDVSEVKASVTGARWRPPGANTMRNCAPVNRPLTQNTGLTRKTGGATETELTLFSATTSSGRIGNVSKSVDEATNSYGVCSCSCSYVIPTQRPLSSVLTAIASKPKKEAGRKALEVTPEMQTVFDHWARVCNHPRTKLEGKVASALRLRLKDGYSVAQLKLVADHGAKDSWLNGTAPNSDKRYNGWETLYYSKDRVEKYLTAALETKSSPAAVRDTRAVELSSTRPITSVDEF